MVVKYFNGNFYRAESIDVNEFEAKGNFVLEVTNEGYPFRGNPEEMANDVLAHLGVYSEFFPIILSTKGGSDNIGRYTTSVTFEAVKSFLSMSLLAQSMFDYQSSVFPAV